MPGRGDVLAMCPRGLRECGLEPVSAKDKCGYQGQVWVSSPLEWWEGGCHPLHFGEERACISGLCQVTGLPEARGSWS